MDTATGAARAAPVAAACAVLLAAAALQAPAAWAYAQGTGDMAGRSLAGPASLPPPPPPAAALESFGSGILAVPDEYLRPADGIGRYVVLGAAGAPGSDHGHRAPLVAVLRDSDAAALRARGHYVLPDFRVDLHAAPSVPEPEPPARRPDPGGGDPGAGAGAALPDASRLAELVSSLASGARGYDGSGVRIAVVDTGVDFSNPDMHHAVARDGSGAPIMLDADGQGIVLTNATFAANIDGNGVVRSFGRAAEEAARENHTSVVYRSRDGVFLDVEQGGEGTQVPVYNSFYPGAGPLPVFNGTMDDDLRIGDGATDYIRSQSGVYRLGAIYQGSMSGRAVGVQVVPVLLVDSRTAGVYDTVIPDMSTARADFYASELGRGEKPDYDFDFTDEEPIRLGEGAEFLVHDSDGDGADDFSAGMVGARVLDVYGVTAGARAGGPGAGDGASHLHDVLNAVNGTLLPPIDPGGEFFGVMTDLVGHGSASAAAIASAGRSGYDVYNNSEKYAARGVAPGASIVPVKALWFGDTLYASMWAAGFDAVQGGGEGDAAEERGWSWRYSGAARADVITHSWGISAFPLIGAVPGADAVSLAQGMIAVPHSLDRRYPGVLVVASAGNSGHGYGTTGTPGASPFVLTVGAATSNAFVGHGAFAGQPRFGNTTGHAGHLVDFTSRGPTPLGHPKPDIVGVGAYGFVPSPVTRPPRAESHEPFGLYGGTSMAAPTVAAAAAVLIGAMRDADPASAPDPAEVRALLMSAASDTGNDALAQGAGMVDVDAAVGAALGENGGFAVRVPQSYAAARDSLAAAVESANATEFGADRFVLPRQGPSPASWFAGALHAGERATASISVRNPSNETLHVTVEPQRLGLVRADEHAAATAPRLRDADMNETGKYAPNYVRLADARGHPTVASYVAASAGPDAGVPAGAGLLVLSARFSVDRFMNSSADTYADDLSIASLYLYDWDDADGDRSPSSSELSMVSRAGSWGTVQEMRVSDPASVFEDTPLVGVYPVPERYSYWYGATGMDAAPLPYTVAAEYYARERWDDVWVSSRTLEVPPGQERSVRATLVVPAGQPSGVYQGFVRVSSLDGGQPSVDPPRGSSSPPAPAAPGGPGRAVPFTADVPVSYAVAEPVAGPGEVVVGGLRGGAGGDGAGAGGAAILDGSGRVRGAFDMTNRYMSGDWRAVYFDVADPSIDTALVDVAWDDPGTTLAAFVAGPDGRILSSTAGPGSFGELLGWPSSDWLGPTPFSEGGGFFPVEARPPSSTGLIAPVNGTGVYTVLLHSTLFGADAGGASERISVVAEFLDLPDRLGRGR